MAGTLSVPFTDAQQAGMAWAKDRFNADHPDDPVVGLQAYAIARCQDVFDSYAKQRAQEQEQTANVKQRYLELDDAGKAEVEALIDSLVSP